jgi:1-acyl-sn-glycerol-3-phosphate acyltransferase
MNTAESTGSTHFPAASNRAPIPGGLLAFGRLLHALLGLLGPIRCNGFEQLPPGPFIVASNHVSYLDSPILLTSVSLYLNTPVAPAGTRGLFVFPLTIVLKQLGAIPIDRRSGDNVDGLRRMLERLQRGPLMIFPEGGRQRSNAARTPQPGLGFLALASGVPVVPARVSGTDRVFRRLPRRTPMSVTVGQPIVFRKQDFAGTPTMQAHTIVVERVMAAIAALG